MSAAILYLPYLPNAEWFAHFLRYDHVLIEREENFVKSTYRNRCEISGANGKQILSIPIVGGRSHHQKYSTTKISSQYDWRSGHWQSIRSAYGSSAYYEFYADRFEQFYNKQFDLLFDQNLELLKLVLTILKLNNHFELTTEYQRPTDTIIDLCSLKQPTITNFPRYYQVFEERNTFIPNLSILDLIFHLGPQTKEYLLSLSII